jgi:pyridoxal phosphate enzyme (YggS family)
MTTIAKRIADNVVRVRESIADAARRSGRRPEDVLLIAVSKYVGVEEIDALVAAGCMEIGENRPQELWAKADQLQGRSIHWHMIGHLQRNKARRTLPHVTLLHSGDSLRLLEAVDRLSQEAGRVADVLVEVNVSGETAKHGFAPDDVEPLLPKLAGLRGLRICGLMAMASWGGSLDEARQDFVRLRNLRERLATACPPEISLDELSMGMSGDFEVAVEEGATMVRIGSALYEGIQH